MKSGEKSLFLGVLCCENGVVLGRRLWGRDVYFLYKVVYIVYIIHVLFILKNELDFLASFYRDFLPVKKGA